MSIVLFLLQNEGSDLDFEPWTFSKTFRRYPDLASPEDIHDSRDLLFRPSLRTSDFLSG
jgi:hypothetical protein